jgi:AcrR family transcriptional regulator
MPRGQFDRSKQRARTRRQLLEAAARVYARCGFDGATLDGVAEEAGFTKGAVYDHFGSKENLLVALVDEHLAHQIAEQVALFDPAKDTSERPRAGSDRWMADLKQDPDAFRLFVELWVHAQRDERLRRRLVGGMAALRETFRGFAAERSASGAVAPAGPAAEQFANVMLALGLGVGMVELADPGSVHPRLLGAVLSLLIGTLESSESARAVLAETGPETAEV